MIFFTLAGAVFAGIYGLFTAFRPKTPLFYKIVVYGFGSYFLAVSYSLLYTTLIPDASGFHAGYFGYIGTFFFLFSSYFGALNHLADGGETQYRRYRILALLPAACIMLIGILRIFSGADMVEQFLLFPVAGTAYFSCKHLLLPDIEMGIIRVMRPYNAIILLFCLIQPIAMTTIIEAKPAPAVILLNTLLVVLALPTAHRGCKKWFT